MADSGIDPTILLTSEEVRLLENLRELEIELQTGLQRLIAATTPKEEKVALKSHLLKVANQKVELAHRLEELSKEEIQEQNKKIKALSHILIDASVQIGARKQPGRSARRRKTLTLPVLPETESEGICICRRRKSIEGVIECRNEYCKNMLYHRSCVGMNNREIKDWCCEECLSQKTLSLKKNSSPRA